MAPQRPRVLHLINTFSVGGAENHLLSLVGNLPRDRFDVTVAFFKEEAQEARSLVPDFRALGVSVVDLRAPRWTSVAGMVRLHRLLRRGDFDLVHTHLFRADILGPPLARLNRVPAVVTTVHNTERFFRNPVVKRMMRMANRRVDRVIAISNAVKQSLVADVGLPAEKIRVVYYGIEPRSESEAAWSARAALRGRLGIPADAFVIGTVGRLAKQKGHRYLIEAFAEVYRRHPEAWLLLVGHDDEGLRPALEALAGRLGVRDRVLLPGYVDGKTAVAAMDLFVLPSLWEGFGLVLLEAMLAGLPVVATNVAAVPEVVRDGETGLLVPPADTEKLAQAMADLLSSPEKRIVMGQRGQQRVVEHFSVQKMVDETVELYEGLLLEEQGVRTPLA